MVGFALSTNWCARRLASGEAIVDEALALGFTSLELGYHTTVEHVAGFKRRLDEMPVGSVHAFAPVPLSAPRGYPELYALASFDEEARKMARFQILKNIAFAADMGADTLVLHMGRVSARSLFSRQSVRRRLARGKKMLDIARRELESLSPELEKRGVVLALENLPSFEAFPSEAEVTELLSSERPFVRAWFDTGHDRVRERQGWKDSLHAPALDTWALPFLAGMHINDVLDKTDDHLPPGQGRVDFNALRPLAEKSPHIVFEPNESVSREDLAAGVAFLADAWAAGWATSARRAEKLV